MPGWDERADEMNGAVGRSLDVVRIVVALVEDDRDVPGAVAQRAVADDE